MKIYVLQGEHQAVPGILTSVHSTPASIDARAWELLKMQADYAPGFSLHTRGADGVSWSAELKRLREWIDSDTLPDIWVTETELEDCQAFSDLLAAARQAIAEVDSMCLDRLHPLFIHVQPLRDAVAKIPELPTQPGVTPA